MNKKSILTTFAVSSLFIFNVLAIQGCQFPSSQSTIIDAQTLDKRIGVLRSLGGIQTSDEGTHLLMLNTGNTILLKSININLNDPSYRDKNVEIEGVLDYTKDQRQIMEVTNIQALSNAVDTVESQQTMEETQETLEVSTQETEEVTQQKKIVTQEEKSEDEVSSPQDEVSDKKESIPLEEIEDFSTFENESFNFSIQYPKNWYFAGSASTKPNVIRHYEFGDAPLEEEPGFVYFDLVSGITPEGSEITVGDKSLFKKTQGNNVDIYIKGANRYYRLSGPSSSEKILLQMASTLSEK